MAKDGEIERRRGEKRERKGSARDEINIGMQISKYFSVTVAAIGGGGGEVMKYLTEIPGTGLE